MVRGNKRYRRGPQIAFSSYDPNQKPERSWKGLWWVGGGLAVVFLLGVGLWLQRGSTRPPPSLPDVVPSTSTGMVTASVVPEEPVVPEIPFSPVGGLTTALEPEVPACYGNVRIVVNAPDYARAFLSKTVRRFRMDTNHWFTVQALPHIVTNAVCGVMDVQLDAHGFKADAPSRRVLIQEASTGEVAFMLTPLPATLMLTCNATTAVAQIGNVKFPVKNVFSVASLQPVRVIVTAAGYESNVLNLGTFEPLTTNRQAVVLEREAEPVPPPVANSSGQNSLGMEVVEIPGLSCRFGRYETRVKDYEVFARETNRQWPKPAFEQGPDHPAVMVSWNDAKAFCAWLTERERKAGRIKDHEAYRLPTDAEWSMAVGLNEPGTGTPKSRSEKITDVYPWGNQWPVPMGAGNYDPSLQVDSYQNTSPVGTFTANKYGLYDMGGNVWEWCEDYCEGQSGSRTLRGASWYDLDYPLVLLSSARRNRHPDFRSEDRGFRVVLGPSL